MAKEWANIRENDGRPNEWVMNGRINEQTKEPTNKPLHGVLILYSTIYPLGYGTFIFQMNVMRIHGLYLHPRWKVACVLQSREILCSKKYINNRESHSFATKNKKKQQRQKKTKKPRGLCEWHMPNDMATKVNYVHIVVHIDVAWKWLIQGINIVYHSKNTPCTLCRSKVTDVQTNWRTNPARYVFDHSIWRHRTVDLNCIIALENYKALLRSSSLLFSWVLS